METNKTDTCNTCVENGNVPSSYGINISERYKVFLWLYHKTGTSHMTKNLKYFDFNFYSIENGKRSFRSKGIFQQHVCEFFPGHEDYKMMVSVRNPYSRWVSWFKMMNKKTPQVVTKNNFTLFVEKNIFNEINYKCVSYHHRKPDYSVRLESLFEDYSKIPFITQSDYYKSGLLKEFCNMKINYSSIDVDWKSLFSQSIADLIYYNTQSYFELFDYDRNSWKN